jgi:hypothetical protein
MVCPSVTGKKHTALTSDNLTEQLKYKWAISLPATSFTTKPTESDLDIHSGLLGEKPYKNRLDYGKAFLMVKSRI